MSAFFVIHCLWGQYHSSCRAPLSGLQPLHACQHGVDSQKKKKIGEETTTILELNLQRGMRPLSRGAGKGSCERHEPPFDRARCENRRALPSGLGQIGKGIVSLSFCDLRQGLYSWPSSRSLSCLPTSSSFFSSILAKQKSILFLIL